MYTFYIQATDLLLLGDLKPFLAFFSIVWILWLLKVFFASQHRDEKGNHTGTFSVIVPVFNEDEVLFNKVLSQISHKKPAQLIVAVDGGSEKMAAIAQKYTKDVLILEKVGKRKAMLLASQKLKKDTDYVLIVDSDTLWTDSTLTILKPFINPKVGGVTGKHVIFDADKTLARKISQWMEDIRFSLVVPAQQVAGNVICLPGRTLAIRRSLVETVLQNVAEDELFGVPVTTGDDREITTQILKLGYNTVYQKESLVETDAPNTTKKFMDQQLRWYRSVIRETFRRFFFYLRKSPLSLIWSFEFIASGPVLFVIMFLAVIKMTTGLYAILPSTLNEIFVQNPALHISLTIAGFVLGYLIRQIYVIAKKPSRIFFIPIFIFYMLLVLLPVKIIALFTFMEQAWKTRKQHNIIVGNVFLARTISILTGLGIFALSFPSVYSMEIGKLNIPFSIVLAGNPVEYYNNRLALNSPSVAGTRTEEEGIATITTIKETKPVEATQNESKTDNQTIEVSRPERNTKPENYVVVAQKGDSVTILSRIVILKYEKDNNLRLDATQRAYVEANLVYNRKQQFVRNGNEFIVPYKAVEQHANDSRKLTTSQKSRWSVYTKGSESAYAELAVRTNE